MFGKRLVPVLLLILFANVASSQQISVAGYTPETYGKGGSITVPVSLTGCFSLDNQFKMYLSDASGSFATPTQIGSYAGFYTRFVNGAIPIGTLTGSNYKVKIVSTNPAVSVETGGFSISATSLQPVVNPITSGSNTINDSTYGRCLITGNQLLTLQEAVPAGYTLVSLVKDAAENAVSATVTSNQLAFTMSPGNYYTVTVKLKNNSTNDISAKSFLVLATTNNLSLQTSGATDICLPDTKSYTINITGNGGIKNNYPGTRYSIEWGDGKVDSYTHCDLVAREGLLLHDYQWTSCGQAPIVDLNPVQYNAFRVNVRATNEFCPNSFTSITTYSKVWQKPKADFVNPVYGCLNKPITFPNNSQNGLSGYNNVVNCIDVAVYEWYVDGNLIFNAGKNLTYTFTTTGMHTVKLVAVNDPCSDEITKEICIEEPLEPDFKINGQDSLSGCAPLIVTVNNLTTFGNGYKCRPTKWNWQVLLKSSMAQATLGVDYTIQPHDSATNPTFTFLKPGQYYIRLSVGNACGTNYKDLPVTITDFAGVSFNFPIRNYCGIKTIDFATDINHRPTYNSNSGIETYSWAVTGGTYSFVGGTTAASAYPKIKFDDFATYTINLTFTNSCGTKTASQQITFDAAVTATASNDTTVCNNLGTIQLKGTATGPSSSTEWSIVNGSGSLSDPSMNNPVYTFSNADRSNLKVTVRYTVSPPVGSACATASDDVVITLLPNNVITTSSAKIICTGTNVNYTPSALAGSTYSWTSSLVSGTVTGNTSSGTGNIDDVLINSSATADAVVKYTITPKLNNCTGQVFILTVTVVPKPDLQIVPSVDTICTGGATNITLSSSYSSTLYAWTAVATSGNVTGFSSQVVPSANNKINQILINTGRTLATVTYTITSSALNGSCIGETKTISVVVRPGATVANAGIDQVLCNQTSTILNGNVATVGSGLWKQISGPASTIVNPSLNNTTINGLQKDSSYTYIWTISGLGQCPLTSDTVKVINRNAITAANAGNDVAVCNFVNTGSVSLNANSDTKGTFETHEWTLLSQPTNGNGIITDPSNPTSTFSFKATGFYKLVWSISNDAGCNPTKDTVAINVVEKPVAGPITGNTDICVGTDVLVTLASHSGTIKKWQYNPAPFDDNIWIDSMVTASNINFVNVADTFAVRVIVVSADLSFGCNSSDTSNILIVNPVPATLPGTTGPDTAVCKTVNSGKISLAGNNGKIIRWESSTDNGSTWTAISNTTSSITYTNLTVTTLFRAVVENGVCGVKVSSPATITVLEPVSQAIVGADQTICNSSTTLEGNPPLSGEQGKWMQISGPASAVFSNDKVPIVTVSSLVDGTYKFAWQLSNGGCNPTADTINVFVRGAVTTANAGNDVVVCDFVTAGSITLNANADTKGAFEAHQWTLLSQPTNGNAIISDSSNPASKFSFKAAGAYQLLWTITNDAGCGPQKDTLTINVYEKPVAGPVSATTEYCGTSDVVVSTAGFKGVIQKWQYNPAPISDNIWRDTLIATPTITFVHAKDTFAVRVIMESSNAKNVCTSTDTSNALIINITPTSLPGTTGPDANVCNNSNSGTITLTGNLGKVIRWEYSEGSGWNTINNTTNSITYNNLTTTRSYRAIVKNGDCPEVTSTTTVITVLNAVTKAIAGADQLICNTSAVLQGNDPGTSEKGEWKQISGPNTATLSGSTTPSINAYDLIAGSYQFSWTISNGACPSSADTVIINVRPTITAANAGSDTVICNFVSAGSIKLNAANTNPGRTYEIKGWKIISQPPTLSATLNNANDPDAIFNFNAPGNYALEWSITNDAGCAPTKDTVIITVVQKPVAGNITATPVVCAGSDVAVNMGSFTGVIRKWQYNPAPINDNIWIDTVVTSSAVNFLNVKDTFAVRAIVDANAGGLGCYSSDTTNVIVVKVIAATIPGSTGPDATVCKGSNSGNIILTGNVGNITRWEYSDDNGTKWNTINNTTTSFNYNKLNTTTLFRAVVESGNCGSAFSSVTKITVVDAVTIAAAGPDQTLCAATSMNLKGNAAATGETVSWKQLKGSSVTFSSTTLPNPIISNLQPGTYSFLYTIANSVCPATSDTVNITILPAIVNTIDTVGKTICAGQTVTIPGQDATGGNGKFQYQWQSSTDGTSWTDINGEYNVSLTIIPTANIYLRRLVNSLPCTSASDPVFITVQAPIANNTINSDQKICINTPAALLNGSLPTGATGIFSYEWQQSVDTGKTWVTIFNGSTQNYNPGTVKVTTSFRRSLTSGYCVGAQSNSGNVVTVVVNPDTKADFTYTKDTNCPPFLIDNTVITTTGSSAANGIYNWYANNKLIGKGISFPGYTLANSNDSVIIKLVTVSSFGCKDDTIEHKFYTKRTAAQPTFIVNKKEGCGPLTVAFTNQTPDITHFTYKWNFGNGLTSTSANPENVIFRTNPDYGDTVYKVSLTVYSDCDSITVYENIRVRSAAQALFKPDHTVGCSPMTVSFTNYSAGAIDFTWNFDDGTIVNTTQTGVIQHTFTSAVQDTFRVSLIARSECGSDTQYYSIVVSPNDIRLLLTVNGDQKAGCSPHRVQLINNSKGATSFRWDLGDGNTLTTTRNIDTITHTYNAPGNYTIKLLASNSCSEAATSETVTVYAKPVVDFSLQPATVCLGDSVHFTNLSDTITGSTWNFGDGMLSNLTNPNHTYTAAGVYTASLIGIRQYAAGSGCIDSASKTVTVIESLPGSFSMSDSVGNCTPFTVTFTNNNLPSKSTVWNFGDGKTDSGNVVKHTFLTTGTFNVTMTSVSPGGCKYRDNKRVVVQGPAGSFTYEGVVKCDKTPVRFKASMSGVDSVRWDFGDGTITKSTDDLVYHTYSTPGNYLPSVKLFGGASCLQLLAGPDTIRVDFIKAGFRQSMTAECENTTVSFRDTSSAYTGIASCAWKFGDGYLDSVQHPTHVYKASNRWLVQLISTSKYGCTDTISNPVAVAVNARPAAAIISDSTACANKKIIFNSSVVSADTVLSYRWSFSNGVNANGTSANNMYANAGTYKATLIVSTINGCIDTASKAITINPAPVINSVNDQIICRGQSVQLNASGANKYIWGPAGSLSCINCSSPIANPVATTRYIVKGVNNFGCESTDTVIVNITQPFKIKASPNDTLCIGEKTELLAAGADKYKWTPSTGLSNTEVSNPLAVPSVTTQYRVIGTDSNMCFSDTAYLTIAVGKYPTVNLGPDKTLSAGTVFPLNPATTNGPITKWSWNPSTDLSCNNCATPVANIKKDINYAVTVTNAYGCTASDTLAIKVFCESTQVFIPNIFTPDGDGVNDILMVRGSGISSVKSFRIFNRWGEIVFEKSNFRVNEKSNGWDGTVRGVKAPTDVYVYTCEVVCENGNSFVYKGNVAIIK